MRKSDDYIYVEGVLVGYHHKQIPFLYDKVNKKLNDLKKSSGKNFIALCNVYQESCGIYVDYKFYSSGSDNIEKQCYLNRFCINIVDKVLDEELQRR